jgi:hypothetical protein
MRQSSELLLFALFCLLLSYRGNLARVRRTLLRMRGMGGDELMAAEQTLPIGPHSFILNA